MFARETMTVQRWYGLSLPIPRVGTRAFVPFLVSSVGIVRSVVERYMDQNISVKFRPVKTALADQDKMEIVINEDYLSGHFTPKIRLNSDDTIASIMGIIVHEAAHFAYSPPTLTIWAEYIRENSGCLFNDQIARVLGNIIEDIYIEAAVGREVPTLSWTLDAVNRVFFTKEVVEDAVESCTGIEDAPANLSEVGNLLNLLILAKTRKTVASTPFAHSLFQEIRQATECYTLDSRLELSLSIYDKLMEKIVSEEEEEGKGLESDSGESSESSGESSESSSEGSGSKPPSSREILDQVEELAKGFGAKEQGSGRVPTSYNTTIIEAEAAIRKLEESKIFLEGGVDGSRAIVYIEQVLPSGEHLEADERYDRLAEVARQKASINRPYGMDRNRGTHIRKLYRIATDQKIFAEPVVMSAYKPMQVIILVDCSGSMYGYYGKSPIENATKAALGAARGLAEARCDVAVYGHTACRTGLNEVTIYQGKAFGEPISVLGSRLFPLIGGEYLRENKDGYAISHVAKKFTSASKRRLLIVISDGSPQAPDYSGHEAILHTKQVVDNVRRGGVDVLSISINAGAGRVNNIIYGEENNVCNDDVNVIESIVRSLIV